MQNDNGAAVILAVLIFITGLLFGLGVGFYDGFCRGFEKALPLTYIIEK